MLPYVLPPIKNWQPFCSEQHQRQIKYQNARIFNEIDRYHHHQQFLFKKENNENDMAAQVFWAVFLFQPTTQQLILMVLPFHPYIFQCMY